MRCKEFLFLALILGLVAQGLVQADGLISDGWMPAGAPGSANPAGARARFIAFRAEDSARAREFAIHRIPKPGRHFEPESEFSLVQEDAQRDRAYRAAPSTQPYDVAGLIKNVNGISYNDSSPSDSTIAAGPMQVVVAVNTAMAVYAKGGGKLLQTGFDDFFADFTEVEGAFFFDPKLAYDQYSGHFLLIVDAYRESDNRSWYMFVVSKTSDVRAGWIGWALDMGLNGSKRTPLWADYPGLGYDSQAIYVTANMFNAPGKFQYAKLRILKKSEVYSFTADLPWYDFWQLKDATGAKSFTVQPVRSYGAVSAEYMVSCNSSQGAALTLWTVANASGATPQLSKRRVNVPSYRTAYDYPAEQKGGGSYLDPGDSRLSDAVNRDGVVYVSHTIQQNWGSGIVSAVRLYRVAASGTLLQSTTFGADGAYYFYPAITGDPKGNMILVFNRSSASEFAGVRFVYQRTGESSLQPSQLLKAGASNYYWYPDEFDVERWGDYSGIANDADGSVWIHGQYADTPVREWTTRIGRLKY